MLLFLLTLLELFLPASPEPVPVSLSPAPTTMMLWAASACLALLAGSLAAPVAQAEGTVTKKFVSSGTLRFGSWSEGATDTWNASFGSSRTESNERELALLDHGKPIEPERFSFYEVASKYRNTQLGDSYGVLQSEKGRCLDLQRMPQSTNDFVPFTAEDCSWKDDASQMKQMWHRFVMDDTIEYFGFFGDKHPRPDVDTLYKYTNTSDANALVGMELLSEQYPSTYWLWYNPSA